MRLVKPKYLPLFIFSSVFFFSLAVYILTLNKYVILGDSGEFITASFEAGIPHPPGYPLFAILGNLFTKIPIGNIVQRTGFVSALFGAATAGLVALLLYRLTFSLVASYGGALALAFSSIFWLYSVNAEVITLVTFFLVLILFLALRYGESKKKFFLYLLAFVTGLSLTNQYSIFAVLPAAILVVLPHRREFLNIKEIVILAVFFILGLTPYIYLPIAASHQPFVNWDNPVALKGFISLITRKEFGSMRVTGYFSGGLNDILTSQLPFYAIYTLRSFGWMAAGLFFVGIIFLKKDVKYLSLIAALFLTGPFLVAYSNFLLNSPFPDVAVSQRRTIEAIYLVSTPLIAIFAGLGIGTIQEKLRKKTFLPKNLISFLTVAVFVFPLLTNYKMIKKSGNDLFDFYGRTILESLPKDSLLIVGGDNTYIFWYLQVVNRLRPDVAVINYSMMQSDWYVDELRMRHPNINFPFASVNLGEKLDIFYEENSKSHTIYFAPLDDQSRTSIPPSYNLIPEALTTTIYQKGKGLEIEDYKEKQDEFWEKINQHYGIFDNYKDLPTQEILMAYARAWTNIGITYENYVKEDWAIQAYERARKISPAYYLSTEKLANLYLKQDEKNYARVIPLYEETLRYNPNHLISLRNLGAIYAESGRYKEAEKLLKRYLDNSKVSGENELIRQIYEQVKTRAY